MELPNDAPLADAVLIDKLTKPTAADVLRFLDTFAGQENDAEEVRDFVQEAARMVDEGKSLYDFGMSGLASFVEWYWEYPPETFAQAWAKFEAKGYRYGRDALENVHFGWKIAKGFEDAND